jgi:thymidylate kinase
MKQTIIILEGHDRSGKSHIAAALSKELDIPVFKVQRNKHDWSPEMNLKYLTEGVTQFLEQSGASAILDRWHPSDYMYDKLFDRPSDLNKIFDIDKRLAKLNTLLVICYKTPEHYQDDPEDADFVNPTMYTKMTDYYMEFINNSKIKRKLVLNTSDENLNNQIHKIKLCLQ